MDAKVIEWLRDQIFEDGRFRVPVGGKWLFVLDVADLMEGEPHYLISYDGGGSLLHDMTRPVNEFRLISAGFTGGAAKMIAEIVNAALPLQVISEAKALTSPKGE
jgi:hypothetical protein